MKILRSRALKISKLKFLKITNGMTNSKKSALHSKKDTKRTSKLSMN